MGYTAKFNDGHSHNQSKKSPSGLPQCSKCGRVFPQKGTKRTSTAAKKPRKAAAVQAKTKIVYREKKMEAASNQLFGEAFRIQQQFPSHEAKPILDAYLKNRRMK